MNLGLVQILTKPRPAIDRWATERPRGDIRSRFVGSCPRWLVGWRKAVRLRSNPVRRYRVDAGSDLRQPLFHGSRGVRHPCDRIGWSSSSIARYRAGKNLFGPENVPARRVARRARRRSHLYRPPSDNVALNSSRRRSPAGPELARATRPTKGCPQGGPAPIRDIQSTPRRGRHRRTSGARQHKPPYRSSPTVIRKLGRISRTAP